MKTSVAHLKHMKDVNKTPRTHHQHISNTWSTHFLNMSVCSKRNVYIYIYIYILFILYIHIFFPFTYLYSRGPDYINLFNIVISLVTIIYCNNSKVKRNCKSYYIFLKKVPHIWKKPYRQVTYDESVWIVLDSHYCI